MAEAEPSPQPEGQAQWTSLTKEKLSTAKASTADMIKALYENDPANFPHLVEKPQAKARDGPEAMRKVDESTELCRKVLDCLEDTCRETGELVYKLRHQKHKMASDLQVTKWRQALRTQRPKSELFRDHLQDALESNTLVLGECSEALAACMKEAKEITKTLSVTKGKLWKDSTVNRHLPNKTAAPAPPSPAAAPAAAPADGAEVPPTPTSPGDPTSPMSDTMKSSASTRPKLDPLMAKLVAMSLPELVAFAADLDTKAKALNAKSTATLLKKTDEANASNNKVNASLNKRTAETGGLKRALEEQMLEVQKVIVDADKSVHEMKRKVETRADAAISQRIEVTEAMLVKMKQTRRTLEDDHRNKVISWKIDDACRKVTPDKASQPVNKSNAAKSALVMEKKTMRRTASSGALTKTAEDAIPAPN